MIGYMQRYAPCTQLMVMNFVNLAMGLFFIVAKILKFAPNLRCVLKHSPFLCSREKIHCKDMLALHRRPQTCAQICGVKEFHWRLGVPTLVERWDTGQKKTAQKVDLTKQVTLCRITNQIPNTTNLLQNSSFSETNNCPREVVVSNIQCLASPLSVP